MGVVKLSSLGEERVVEKIVELLDKQCFGERLGPGDDARDILSRSHRILFSIDGYSIESVLLPWRTLRDVGWAIVTGSISDIVSKSGVPEGVMASIGVPSSWSLNNLLELVTGVREACSYYKTRFLGGDTNSSETPWITVAVVGFTSTAYPPPRSGARIGDTVIVVGDNYGAMGVVALDGVKEASRHRWVIEKTKRPTLYLDTALVIQKYGKNIHASMDVSDGLAYTLHTIAKLSNTGIEIYDKPVYPRELDEYCRGDEKCIWDRILYGGEEYGVVLITDPNIIDNIKKDLDDYGIPYRVVGRIVSHREVVVRNYGVVKPKRWDQFSGWN